MHCKVTALTALRVEASRLGTACRQGQKPHPCAEKPPGGVLLPCEPFSPLAIMPITVPASGAPYRAWPFTDSPVALP